MVYSITDSASFETAVSLVETLCLIGETSKKGQVVLGERPYAVVLVANKGDLVRNRKVYETGECFLVLSELPSSKIE